MGEAATRFIAFYLPQYHPIPENDAWWGKGFTEWTNVVKAKPLFRGHYQPHIPADLGFYDLRVPETRAAQAELARDHGIEGFCYWHYWFAGKRLLERPFNEVLRSGEPDFPFCLAWANQSWTGVWHGAPDRVLIEQTYPGPEDHEAHFYTLLEAFGDDRYLTVEGKPIFVVYNPKEVPELNRFTEEWRDLAVRSGLKGLYLVGVGKPSWDAIQFGFDASIPSVPALVFQGLRKSSSSLSRICRAVLGKTWNRVRADILGKPEVYPYRIAVKHALVAMPTNFERLPCLIPNWDNTPRSGTSGIVLHNSTPELFRLQVREALEQVRDKEFGERLVFIKSWNEWAEGNYLEPDQRFGRGYLEVLREETLV